MRSLFPIADAFPVTGLLQWGVLSNTPEGLTSSQPAPVPGQALQVAIASNGNYACGLSANDTIACFGEDGFSGSLGSLGLGYDVGFTTEPLPVAGGLAYKSLSAGFDRVCGTLADGRAYCWVSTLVTCHSPSVLANRVVWRACCCRGMSHYAMATTMIRLSLYQACPRGPYVRS